MRLLYGGRRARDFGLTNNSMLYGHNETEMVNLSQNYFEENYLFEILYRYEKSILDD